MAVWHKTGCVLCTQNCGLEVLVEDGRMVKVRPDNENPRSRGYACRKGLNVINHQYPIDRLTVPMKRAGSGFETISWEQAIDEIAQKIRAVVDENGPQSLAYMGGGAQGGWLEAAFGLTLLRGMGSQYYYSSSGQEFSGLFWVSGRLFGKQYLFTIPDEEATEILVAWGWNGMESHQMPRAPKVLTEFSKDPERLLVAIDPRKSETAGIANIHLAVRPGTDALLMKAMISIIWENGWEAKDYIEKHVLGWDRIKSWFEGFDSKAALDVCQLDYEKTLNLCRLLTTRRWCVHPDLGLYMGRHGTLNMYFLHILGVVCGIYGRRGGNVFPGLVMPMGFHADERNEKTWRTVATGMPPAAAGSFPPSVMPEEILADHPHRLRAVLVSGSNPLRAYPDTAAYEKAFSAVDLLVVSDIAMTETARLAHYVLPCRTFYESWDTTFMPLTFPKVYGQLRGPIVSPPESCLEASQIYTLLADKLGLIPAIPDELVQAAQENRLAFAAELMGWAKKEPGALKSMPLVLSKTLGRVWDSASKAAFWGMLMTAPSLFRANAERAGFPQGSDQGERIFQALLDHPEGLWIGEADAADNLASLQTASKKIEIHIPELEESARSLNAVGEEKDLEMPREFPFILNAGRHTKYNANTMMRNPEWNKGKRACTIALNPTDAEALGLQDGGNVRVTTKGGSVVGELEVSDRVRQGMVLIPHGFGLRYADQTYGLNVNYLTQTIHRDMLGTPMHRFIPCRVTK